MVRDRKRRMSSGRRHGISSPAPMTPCASIAAMIATDGDCEAFGARSTMSSPLHRDRGSNVGVRFVALQLEILIGELCKLLAIWVEMHSRHSVRRPR